MSALAIVSMITDATSIIAALTPLVTQQLNGQVVTDEDVRQALAGKDAALDRFDALIARREIEGNLTAPKTAAAYESIVKRDKP